MKMDRVSAEDLLREGRFRHAHDPLAELLATAAEPAPIDRELPGEAAALAAFRAARTAPPPGRSGLLRDVLARLLTVKVAAFGLIAVTGVGGVALVAVAAPLPNSDRGTRPATARSQSSTTQPLPAPSADSLPAVPLVEPGVPDQPARSTPSPGQLCRELTGMDDRQRDRALRDVRYHDLVRDAGGTDRVGTFCDDQQGQRGPARSPAPQNQTYPSDPRDGDRSDDDDRPRDGDQNGYPGGRPSTPPSVSSAPKPPPRG